MRLVVGCWQNIVRNPQASSLAAVERLHLYSEMNLVLAALHEVDVNKVGLAYFGRPGSYYERQISHWTTQYLACETQTIEAMNELITWLPDNVPDDARQVSLIHVDYRIDNIIFYEPTLQEIAVLDWELSTLGHSFADLACQCVQWRLQTDAVLPGLGGAIQPKAYTIKRLTKFASQCATEFTNKYTGLSSSLIAEGLPLFQ